LCCHLPIEISSTHWACKQFLFECSDPSLVFVWLKPISKWDLGSKFVWTNLDSFEANWILELDHAVDLSLHLGSSNHELSFLVLVLGWNKLNFPQKMVPCRFNLHLPLFGLGPSRKGNGSNLWISSNKIALFH
jgi:hypothetical protein